MKHAWPSSVWIRFGFSDLLQDHRHGTGDLQLVGDHGLALVCVADSDRAEPPAEIVEVVRDRADGHHLGGGRDVEARFARVAVRATAEPDD